MAQITVKVRSDIGDPGTHPKFGKLKPGSKVVIEPEDFAAELFERPTPDYLSPHEQSDKTRSNELKQTVGSQIYIEPAPAKKNAAASQEV